MPANPLIAQGVLNRLRASVSITNNPTLNVTSPYLTREAIRLAIEGEATQQLPTLTGVVQSPEPFQMVTVTMHLIKSQALSDAYKQQFETDTLIGDIVIRPDSTTLGAYDLTNCSLQTVEGLDFSGAAANFTVRIRGAYYINSTLWQ